jgi:hypothetical protein
LLPLMLLLLLLHAVVIVQWRIDLPNTANAVVNSRFVAVVFIVGAYGVGAPLLYRYMLLQRVKKLKTKSA